MVLVARVPTVEVVTCDPQTETIILYGHGTVETATRTAIRPQVSGRVIELHERLEPGEVIERDIIKLFSETLLGSEPPNLRLAPSYHGTALVIIKISNIAVSALLINVSHTLNPAFS